MKKYIIYEHISPSGKIYVGITCTKPEYRWNHGRGYGQDQICFKRAIDKYGWNSFKHIILASNLGEKTAKNMEKDLIKFNKDKHMSYNATDGGDGVIGVDHSGWKHTEETKRRFSEMRKGVLAGEKNPMYGRRGKDSLTYGKRGKDHPASKCVYQYSLEGLFIKMWNCMTDAAISIGKTQKEVTHITACCNGRSHTAFGYIWRKYDTELKKEDLSIKRIQKKTTTNK